MNKRAIVLLLVAVLLGIGYLVFLAGRRPGPLMLSADQIGDGPVVFSFNDEVLLDEVKVIRPPDDPDLEPEDGEVLWHLVPREQREGEDTRPRRPLRAFKYGGWVRGMQRGPLMTGRRPPPLEPGQDYLLIATVDGREHPLPFTTKPR